MLRGIWSTFALLHFILINVGTVINLSGRRKVKLPTQSGSETRLLSAAIAAIIWCIPRANNLLINVPLSNYCTLVPTSQHLCCHPNLIPATSAVPSSLSFPSSSKASGTTRNRPGRLFFCPRGEWWNTWLGRQNQGWGRKDTEHIGIDDRFCGTKMSIHGFDAGFGIMLPTFLCALLENWVFLIESSFPTVYWLPVSPDFPGLLEMKASGRGLLKY